MFFPFFFRWGAIMEQVVGCYVLFLSFSACFGKTKKLFSEDEPFWDVWNEDFVSHFLFLSHRLIVAFVFLLFPSAMQVCLWGFVGPPLLFLFFFFLPFAQVDGCFSALMVTAAQLVFLLLVLLFCFPTHSPSFTQGDCFMFFFWSRHLTDGSWCS